MATEVNQPTKQLDRVRGEWQMLSSLLGGTDAMRKAGEALLPRWPAEDNDFYKVRLNTAVLHPAFSHTCGVMSSKPFSRAMTTKVPSQIEELFKDIDRKGTPFPAFAASLFKQCLGMGLIGVLADFPPTQGLKTKADEQEAGARPYLVTYPAESILGWVEGSSGLELLRLMETVEEKDGEWGIAYVQQVRVLRPGAWEIWRKSQTEKDKWVKVDEGITTIKVIPFQFFYGLRLAFGVGQCPQLDLAYQNVEHWQSSSDQQTITHVARIPILFGKVLPEDKPIVIGSNSAVIASNKDADLKYVEHTGKAIEAGQQSIEDLEERMRATGASLLSKKPVPITATQSGHDSENGKSLLQTIIEMFEDSLEGSLNQMALYIGGEQTAEVDLYKDFSAFTDGDPMALASARSGGVISSQTHFEELRRRDIVSSDATWEEEQKRLETDRQLKIKDEAETAAAVAKTQVTYKK